MGQSVLITALLLGTLLTGGLSACGNGVPDAGNLLPDSGGAVAESQLTSDAEFAQLFERQQSGVAVLGQGTVIRILEDDNAGDRHQRFIVQLTSGQTLLIAHNIDIAPRVPGLQIGSVVQFSGIYEYNAEGGTVHWTHHDPEGLEPGGWIYFNGQRYQ